MTVCSAMDALCPSSQTFLSISVIIIAACFVVPGQAYLIAVEGCGVGPTCPRSVDSEWNVANMCHAFISMNFFPSKDVYFQNLASVKEANGWLKFKAENPLTLQKMLLIRESYDEIAQSILGKGKGTAASSLQTNSAKRNYSLITGIPGIGKSVFLYYFLWLLLMSGKRVLFLACNPTVYYDQRKEAYDLSALPPALKTSFWGLHLWCLVDSQDPTKIKELPLNRCNCVLATTLRDDISGAFCKLVPTPKIFYMPLWDESECEKMATACYSDQKDWQARFKALGGVPRIIFEDVLREPRDILFNACRQCSLEDCTKVIGLDTVFSATPKIVQTLIHVKSSSPYTRADVCYASNEALDLIVHMKRTELQNRLRSLLDLSEENSLTASLCGYIFEPYAFEMLENGGVFTCRQLVSGHSRIKPAVVDIEIKKSHEKRLVVDKIESGQSENQLYVPKTRNFTAFDAWIPQIGAFQMTVGKKHDIKGNPIENVQYLGEKGKKLHWVLPPAWFHTFTIMTPQSLEQWALLINYPPTT